MNDEKKETPEDVTIESTGEDNVEEIELEAIDQTVAGAQKKLRDKLKICEKEKAEHLENLQRAKADFLNTRKRLEEQALASKDRTLEYFLASLLPLCDSFDMALSNQKAWEAVDEDWRKGVEGIKSQLEAILKQHDVVEIKAEGKTFDPNKHEAVSSIDGEADSDKVIEILQKGYERNGTVIRPAKVIIQN